MTIDAILDADGNEMPRGILDAIFTSLIAMHDLQGNGRCIRALAQSTSLSRRCMARRGSLRVELSVGSKCVEPGSQHPENGHYGRRAPYDGEPQRMYSRREERVVFINTGFLDRTGDEMHASMEAGPMIHKGDMSIGVDRGVRGLECRYRTGMRLARQCPNRQGHVGNARSDGDMLEQK